MHVRDGYTATANVMLSRSESVSDAMRRSADSILCTNRDCEKVEPAESRKINEREYEMKFKLFPKPGLSDLQKKLIEFTQVQKTLPEEYDSEE